MWWIVALRVPPAEDSDSCVETIELTEVIQFLTDHVNLDNKQLIHRCLRSFMLSSVNLDESGISMLQIVPSLTPWHCGPSQFDPVEYRFDVEVQTNLHLGGLRSLPWDSWDVRLVRLLTAALAKLPQPRPKIWRLRSWTWKKRLKMQTLKSKMRKVEKNS